MTDDEPDLWEEAGRKAAAARLEESRYDVEAALYDITVDTMHRGGNPTPEQIREARMALNLARRVLETTIAPAAGCEPWDGPLPDIPFHKYRELHSEDE